MIYRYFVLILFSIILFSCGPKLQPVLFPVEGSNHALSGLSREAVEGRLLFSGKKKFEYRFAVTSSFSYPTSMEIEYSVIGDVRPVLDFLPSVKGASPVGTVAQSWILPSGGVFNDCIVHYAIPVDYFPEYFSIAPLSAANDKRDGVNSMQIHSIEFKNRWYGFSHLQEPTGEHLYISPFVSEGQDNSRLIQPLGIPAIFSADFFPMCVVSLLPGHRAIIDAGSRSFEVWPHSDWLLIPAGIIAPDVKQLTLSGDNIISFSFGYASLSSPVFLVADPGMILEWPVERWRDRRYEVFAWDRFPSLLIFDTADYAVQNRMFKRLAFFVEKAGFRGRLAPDDEIAELHGWNAHDYRAEDLARFFQKARETNFPLLAEELELENLLRQAGIIVDSDSGIQAGKGGIISISRESADYLRYRFMAHECFHGLFFIDEDFRAFTRTRWQQLPADAKRFLVSFFGFQQYDTADEYLMVNEFMAHVLQQSVSQAGRYFGQTLPALLEDSWRKAHLPAKDGASNSWPTLATAFTREAEAFSAYVNNRWGLAAGRVHLVTVKQP
jgi:hypothetical protein